MPEQLGMEQSPEEYVDRMVGVFREVRRVLRNDGILWLNLGDSYASGGTMGASSKSKLNGGAGVGPNEKIRQGPIITRAAPPGLKPKDLVGIPWRVAFALQADGWYLRQDIIWHKPNAMPESVTDRCTKAHEYIFLLAKSARYYYDAKAIKEKGTTTGNLRLDESNHNSDCRGTAHTYKEPHKTGTRSGGNLSAAYVGVNWAESGINRRSVWTVATKPYSEAHFAVYPPELITPCILAGCPMGGTVLDPFGGSGTTAEVAEANGRNSIIIELNPSYVNLAEQRTAQAGLFCQPLDDAPGIE
jgi:DNA modification methylase